MRDWDQGDITSMLSINLEQLVLTTFFIVAPFFSLFLNGPHCIPNKEMYMYIMKCTCSYVSISVYLSIRLSILQCMSFFIPNIVGCSSLIISIL